MKEGRDGGWNKERKKERKKGSEKERKKGREESTDSAMNVNFR
jgi:hypothetical protein